LTIADSCDDDDYGAEPNPELLTHREVGRLLGVGRARVFYQEKTALQRLRDVFETQGIQTPTDFYEAPNIIVSECDDETAAAPSYSPLHGWLTVQRIISLNDGTTEPGEVATAYQYLKEIQETLMRPPLLVTSGGGVTTPYRIEATAFDCGMLRVRAWPVLKVSRSVQALVDYPCTAIVESICDADDSGDFDVPLLVCIIVSQRDET